MNKDNTYYESLIGRYLNGEAGPSEISELAAWVSSAEENRLLFTRTRKAWALAESVNMEVMADVDAEWAALKKSLGQENSPVVRKLEVSHRRSFLRVAAILLVFILPSVIYFLFFMNPGMNSLVADARQVEETLPDGTQVTLNTGSSLQYPSEFKGSERRVALQGEAYFDVAHKPEMPFVIEAGDLQVKVLGTTFYMNAREDDEQMEVVLLSGSVALSYAGKDMLLEPGQKAVMLKKQREIVRQPSDDPNLLAWKTRVLRFNDTPLQEIVELLSKVYQRDIRLMNQEISDCRLTATFEKESLEAILMVLQSTLDINVRPNGQVIELSGESCE